MIAFYNLILRLKGPAEAKRVLSDVVYILVTNIQEEGMVVTNEELEKRFEIYTKEFIEASKSDAI